MTYPEIIHIKRNPALEGQVELYQNVVYSTETGTDLKMTLFVPWNMKFPEIEKERKPLIVFVQGSAWTTPDFDFEIPQLAMFARKGYVVATVGHRDTGKGHPFPAYLQDVKCAVRFLRKHSAEYGIDPERVAIWGTSSGGNTALLVGLTGDDPAYETSEHQGYSDAVNAVVECFGPTDMIAMGGERMENPQFHETAENWFGKDRSRWMEAAAEMSPITHVKEGKEYPPFMLLHGTADDVVPFDQMTVMYHRLLDCGVNAEAYQIDGAVHEHDFWSDEVYQRIEAFISKNI